MHPLETDHDKEGEGCPPMRFLQKFAKNYAGFPTFRITQLWGGAAWLQSRFWEAFSSSEAMRA
jgi:hypothetical protein